MEIEADEQENAIYRTIEWGSKKGIDEYLHNKIEELNMG